MNPLKCNVLSPKGTRKYKEIIAPQFLNRKSVILLLFTSFLLLPTSHLSYALGACKWDSNGVVVCNEIGSQGGPHIVTDGRNGAIISWNWGQGIYAQRIDSLGSCLWASNGVPIITSWVGSFYDIIADGWGGAIVAWQTEGYNIYAQRVDSSGSCLWTLPNGVPVCTDIGLQEQPVIASDDHGGAIIAWRGVPDPFQGGNQFGVYAQRIDSVGNIKWTLDGIALAPDHDSLDQAYAQIIGDGSGGAIVTWMQVEDTTVNPEWDIYAQRVDANGIIKWGISGLPICNADSSQEFFGWGPSVTGKMGNFMIKSGNECAIIMWADYRIGNWDIYAQRVDTFGVLKWAINGIPICNFDGTQGGGSIVEDSEGGGVVTWVDDRNGDWDIYAQRVDSLGVIMWATSGIPICNDLGTQALPQICSDLAGGAVIVWQDTVPGNRNWWDIYCQRIDSNGNCLWQTNGMAVCVQDSGQFTPAIVSDSTISGAIIAWRDQRTRASTSSDIYAQRVGDTIIVGKKEMPGNKYEIPNIRLEVHPNPFTKKVKITYMIGNTRYKNQDFSLKIYDITGTLIRNFSLPDVCLSVPNSITWDGIGEAGEMLGNGLYFCVFESEYKKFTTKVIYVK